MPKHSTYFLKPHLLALAIGAILSHSAFADDTDDKTSAQTNASLQAPLHADLGKLKVTFVKRAHRRSNEITGLGKVVKSSDDINEEMTLNIRDLTRYDPGISVVEQGRGATSGYAMRGVDKNRVAMLVDGLAQAQSYLTLKSDANGGAINEIEYENIKSIELSKGASSAEYGSGALGGAVGFVTKDSSDIIKVGKDWGVDTKTAYSSKNGQFTQSVAGAVKHDKFDHLAIFTVRKGHETDIHPHAKHLTHAYNPLVGYFYVYDNSTGDRLGRHSYYVIDGCATPCTPNAFAQPNSDNKARQTSPNLTGDAKEMADKIPYPTHYATATEYTGKERIAPNPLDYRSTSLFYKGGYRISPLHYVGGILERTQQRYDSRDMTFRSYYTKDDNELKVGNNLHGCFSDELKQPIGNCGIAEDGNPLSGLVHRAGNEVRYGLNYAKGLFIDENHSKGRYGLSYQYDNPNKDSFADSLKVSLDRQTLELDTHRHETRCTVGSVEKCRASIDKPWSHYRSEQNRYTENLWLGQATWTKELQFAKAKHRLTALAGLGRTKSVLHRGNYFDEYVIGTGYQRDYGLGTGSYDDPATYKRLSGENQLVHLEVCNANASDNRDCNARAIRANQAFLAVRDLITLNQYVDLGLGVRYDRHAFKSDDVWTPSRTYNNVSWNAGLSVKPTDWLVMSYRYSNGFRVPAFYELYGPRTGLADKDNPLIQAEMKTRKAPDPERSQNHEFGIGLRGDFGTLETSVFSNEYKGMLAIAQVKGTSTPDFYNVQDVRLTGVNVLGKLDWYSVNNKLPDGLYSTLAYNEVKVKDRQVKDGYAIAIDPILDAVQPARVIAGLGYDSPDGKWGVGSLTTYSTAKKDNELTGNRYYGAVSVDVLSKKSRAWYTYDLTGYYHLNDHLTLRAGIYNLANRKYSTWESVRQSTINAVNQDTGSPARYAATGRNFVLSLEGKF